MSSLNPDYSKRESAIWKKFFDSYPKLTCDIARKAGLTDGEAQEVIQEVIMSVAQKTPNLGNDFPKGSFKSWVIQLTRRRISDKLRKKRDGAV